MFFLFTENGLKVGRDLTDKRIYKDSTVIYYILKNLNSPRGAGIWKRFYPYRHGLTACKIGIRNSKTGVIYWHKRYQVESAYKAFNNGDLFLLKVNI